MPSAKILISALKDNTDTEESKYDHNAFHSKDSLVYL